MRSYCSSLSLAPRNSGCMSISGLFIASPGHRVVWSNQSCIKASCTAVWTILHTGVCFLASAEGLSVVRVVVGLSSTHGLFLELLMLNQC